MTANIIDGKKIAADIRKEIAEEVALLNKKVGVSPALAVVLVGEDPASAVYVRNKKRACEEIGIRSVSHDLSAENSEADLLKLIDSLNNDKEINGILVQLPLPKHISEAKVLEAIRPEKDVDCFHPVNVGLLSLNKAYLKPCTPAGVIELLDRSGIKIEGKDAVIIGRSNIVGKPAIQLLLQRNATVTVCHSKTKDIGEKCKKADIIVAAVGIAEFLKGNMVKEGAVIIDVGINRNAEGKLVGDVAFDEVSKVASYITPVPGGVGPMTIAMLMKNTLTAFKVQRGIKD
ncbi:MAG: bifunctional methylenetetrahydrofolate dehydrogenase/methenyltetrahydrofolate cyclohydrolase FolD [Nitrospinota bacterium]|nr:bifunctional methylenetetrahydrofolate dehydrogenase/methenyltetrahydrofolate cyclohydrolase FolD [Nitrospinota bacterium]